MVVPVVTEFAGVNTCVPAAELANAARSGGKRQGRRGPPTVIVHDPQHLVLPIAERERSEQCVRRRGELDEFCVVGTQSAEKVEFGFADDDRKARQPLVVLDPTLLERTLFKSRVARSGSSRVVDEGPVDGHIDSVIELREIDGNFLLSVEPERPA